MTLKPAPTDHQPIRFLKWTLWLPVVSITTGLIWLKHLVVKPKSETQILLDNKAKQKRIKRQLRGLTDEHPSASK